MTLSVGLDPLKLFCDKLNSWKVISVIIMVIQSNGFMLHPGTRTLGNDGLTFLWGGGFV